ncbi:MAG: protein kinase [Deltaproteobacteria bacterium]|nr:protein kinase [Deltaproteobacteria bacterium]
MSDDPNVGLVFGGRWQVERPLSSGGMGSVYVARHGNTGRLVALKVVKGEGAASQEFVARFMRETQALASLSHPNVVTFLDSGCDHGKCFLVMELLQGRSLRALMGTPCEWRHAFRIGADLCRALAAVHKQGIVHRDLKPENVFLQEAEGHDEIAKLIDFGIVRLQGGANAATLATSTGSVVGTPGYISPEQLQGQQATAASDVYAVGVILYELVTGRFPFEAATPHAMLVKQLIEPLQPPRNALATVPSHVEAVILHFMERDPARRSSTALAALAELQEALKRIDSLAPDAATETGDAFGKVAQQVLATRATEPTGTVAPLPMLAAATPSPPAKGGSGSRVGLVLALCALGGLSMCAMCVVVASSLGDDERARHGELRIEGDVDGVSPETAVRLEEQAQALRQAEGAAEVARAIGGLAGSVGDAIDEEQAARDAARAARAEARASRPSRDEARALVLEQLMDVDCEGEPPPHLKRVEFSVESGRVRLVTPPRDNALLQCIVRAARGFSAPEFRGGPVSVVISDDDVF